MTELVNVFEPGGPPSRHVDPITEQLAMLAKAFEDAQRVRKASQNRGDELAAELFLEVERKLSGRLGRKLEKHVLWPWLEPLKGLAGPLTARVISYMGNPRRFPGQQCSMGHTLPPLYPVGASCPVTADRVFEIEDVNGGDGSSSTTEEDHENEACGGGGFPHTVDDSDTEIDSDRVRCVGVMRHPRPGTGVRSFWHYAGLHVVDGKLPRRRKGQQADWNPTLRTLALKPKGIADQIIKHRTPVYRDTYDAARERGKYYKVARTIAAKQFLGDLLTEWKDRLGEVESCGEIEVETGLSELVTS